MRLQWPMGVKLLAVLPVSLASKSPCTPSSTWPDTYTEFSSTFHQPLPPTLQTEFKANWVQHKWDVNVTHTAAGFLYNSPNAKKVRVDEAYDSNLASSLFDYSNVTEAGVANTMYSWSPSIASKPETFHGYVNPVFPIFTPDQLLASNGVFSGLVDTAMNGKVATWSIIYQGQLPVTVYVNTCNVVVGYDFFSPVRRTRAITEFFNIIVGPIDKDIFDFPA